MLNVREANVTLNRIMVTVIVFISLCAILALSSCSNALMVAVKNLQAQTVTPTISVSLANGTVLNGGSTFDFGTVTVGETHEVEFTIKNNGKTALTIADNAVSITGTGADKFTITQKPATSIATGGISALRIMLSCPSTGSFSPILAISSNDINSPSLSFQLTTIILDIPRPGVPASLTVASFGSDPGNYTNLKLTWSTSSNSTAYEVQRETYLYGSYSKTFSVSGGGTSTITDTTCIPGTVYYYRVYAINGTLKSINPSAIANWTTTGTPVTGISINPFSTALNSDLVYPAKISVSFRHETS